MKQSHSAMTIPINIALFTTAITLAAIVKASALPADTPNSKSETKTSQYDPSQDKMADPEATLQLTKRETMTDDRWPPRMRKAVKAYKPWWSSSVRYGTNGKRRSVPDAGWSHKIVNEVEDIEDGYGHDKGGINALFSLPARRKFPEVDWRGFNEDVFHESFGDFNPMMKRRYLKS